LRNNYPIYDNYESEFQEGSEGDDIEMISVATTENEEEIQDQPLMTSFPANVDQQIPEIGEPVFNILQSEIEDFTDQHKEYFYSFQDPVEIYMELKWSRELYVFDFLRIEF
jgi:hypothetical protein